MSITPQTTSQSQPQLEEQEADGQTCPECNGPIRETGTERVCEDCQLVIEDELIQRAPQVKKDDHGGFERQRTGPAQTERLHDKGLTTQIGYNGDGKGNTLPSQKRQQVARMRKEDRRGRFQNPRSRYLSHGLAEVTRLVTALGMPSYAVDQACRLFRTAQNEDILIGRTVEGVAAGCVLAVARCNELPERLDDIAPIAQRSRSRISNAYQVLNEELGLPTPPPTSRTYIPQIVSELDYPAQVETLALDYATLWEDDTSSTGKPSAVAAACVYEAADDHGIFPTQMEVANTIDTYPKSLRTHLETIRELKTSDA